MAEASEKFSREAKARVRRYAESMFDLAVDNARQHWKIKTGTWNPSFSLKWSGSSSWGWETGIELVFDPEEVIIGNRFAGAEYEHIAKDPEIGSFFSSDWRPVILALIAHELAHSLTILKYPEDVNLTPDAKNYDGQHGKRWQSIYRWLMRHGFQPGKRMKAPKLAIQTLPC